MVKRIFLTFLVLPVIVLVLLKAYLAWKGMIPFFPQRLPIITLSGTGPVSNEERYLRVNILDTQLDIPRGWTTLVTQKDGSVVLGPADKRSGERLFLTRPALVEESFHGRTGRKFKTAFDMHKKLYCDTWDYSLFEIQIWLPKGSVEVFEADGGEGIMVTRERQGRNALDKVCDISFYSRDARYSRDMYYICPASTFDRKRVLDLLSAVRFLEPDSPGGEDNADQSGEAQ